MLRTVPRKQSLSVRGPVVVTTAAYGNCGWCLAVLLGVLLVLQGLNFALVRNADACKRVSVPLELPSAFVAMVAAILTRRENRRLYERP